MILIETRTCTYLRADIDVGATVALKELKFHTLGNAYMFVYHIHIVIKSNHIITCIMILQRNVQFDPDHKKS